MKLASVLCALLTAPLTFLRAHFSNPAKTIFIFLDWDGCTNSMYDASHMTVLKGTLTQLNLLYKECSYDNDNFRYDFSTIHPEPITLPCQGTSYLGGLPYDFNSQCCGGSPSDIDMLFSSVQKQVDISKHNYVHFLNLPYIESNRPPGYACRSSGKAVGGLLQSGQGVLMIPNIQLSVPKGGGDDPTFIYRAALFDSLFHETGHMMSLNHAYSRAHEYGDWSSPMGVGNGMLCHIAPHSFALGWSTPVVTLQVTPNDRWTDFQIPILTKSSVNQVLIKLPNSNHVLYVSVRSKTGNPNVDQQLTKKVRGVESTYTDFEQKVVVHSWERVRNYENRGTYISVDNKLTLVIATVSRGDTFDFAQKAQWWDASVGFDPQGTYAFTYPTPEKIAIKHTSFTPGVGSTVSICFYTTSASACSEGFANPVVSHPTLNVARGKNADGGSAGIQYYTSFVSSW